MGLAGTGPTGRLAAWATGFRPGPDDLDLAGRALLDTLAVALAARTHPLPRRVAPVLPEPAAWAVAAHVLDFDDLHLPSTTHVSAVCVPAAVASGGGARAFLAGAGVMARLGSMLGWPHYTRGWHATCTAGAPAAAAAAAVAWGLDEEATARALALAVPAAGGVQRAFGTDAKAVQVGQAVAAGLQAARLAAAGVGADPAALDAWLDLVGAGAVADVPDAPAVPGGLAVKLHPCCYALQRPIAAVREVLAGDAPPGPVGAVRVATPRGTTQPLIHHRPTTGLAGKFSLEYAVAATLLDGYPDLASFTDAAVRRPAAQRLLRRVLVEFPGGPAREPGRAGGTGLAGRADGTGPAGRAGAADAGDADGAGLLDGEVTVTVEVGGRIWRSGRLAVPPGAPARPPGPADLAAKAAACGPDVPGLLAGITWEGAADVLRHAVAGSGA
jgi:hypothetical protein